MMQNSSFLKNLFKGISTRISKTFSNPYREVNIDTFKLKYLKHLPPGSMRKHKMLGGVISYTNPQELLHGLDELFIDKIYKVALPPNPFIIDCGANIGLSVIYLKQLYPDARILAFEPDRINYDLLIRNIKSFGFTDVTVLQEAVWNENTHISFAAEGSMSSKIDTNNTNNTTIKAARLKDYLDKKVNFLKIDIEGAEYVVLRDIRDNLQNVDNLFLEYHGKFEQNNQLVEMLEIVNKAGFSFYVKEAADVYSKPFVDAFTGSAKDYDLQLNIFCFRKH